MVPLVRANMVRQVCCRHKAEGESQERQVKSRDHCLQIVFFSVLVDETSVNVQRSVRDKCGCVVVKGCRCRGNTGSSRISREQHAEHADAKGCSQKVHRDGRTELA